MCCNTKAADFHALFSILLLLPILRLFYPPLYITITVLLRILEIEDEPLLLIYKSLARSVSLSLEMPRLSLSFCRRSRSRSLPRCHCRDRLQESQSRPIEQPINLKGGISTNKYIFIWMCLAAWVWVKIVQSQVTFIINQS